MLAAEELFGTRAASGVSVDEIVARAGVAKGTFYNHFTSKDDLARQLALAIRLEVRDRIADRKVISSDPAVHLAIAVILFLDLARRRPNRARILSTLLSQASDADADPNSRVRQTLEAGKAGGRFRFGSIDAAMISVIGIVSAGIQSLVDHEALDAGERIVSFAAHALASLGLSREEAEDVVGHPLLASLLQV
jgi:AcrR family transcriptional regulator